MGEVVDFNHEEVNKVEQAETGNGKISYEELENFARQISGQNADLQNAIRELQMEGLFKRLDYLLKVVHPEYSGVFNEEFVSKAASEIESIITIPEEATEA